MTSAGSDAAAQSGPAAQPGAAEQSGAAASAEVGKGEQQPKRSATPDQPNTPDKQEKPEKAPKTPGRAGRDLPAAIAVGVVLATLILLPLYTIRVIWIGVICAAVTVGTYELVRALHIAALRVPLVPLVLAAPVLPALAYARGSEGLAVGALVAVVVALAWRILDPAVPLLRDLPATAFTVCYVGFLAGFAALLSMPADGPRRVTIFIATTAASDIGGYAAGVLSGGRHKMAPSISPGKSWEGLVGSAVVCMIVAGLLVPLLLDAAPLEGVAFGLAVAGTATVGDLGESMLKRDIGIKDMSHLLPGHGGIMDRLDSLLITAPVAWLLLTTWAK
jgi:phosphatidate cytidylyltransferase